MNLKKILHLGSAQSHKVSNMPVFATDLDIVKELNVSAVRSPDSPYSIRDAKLQRYRFLHIPSYLDNQVLKLVSAAQLPENKYACLSFVWSGLEGPPGQPSICIDGLGTADNVPIEGLRIACAAAKHLGHEYIWVDKFCLRQDEDSEIEDKPWQLAHMYEIYSKCGVCVVAPGGLARLAELDEKTTYLERAWTLQESLAPKDVRFLFRWTRGPSILQHNGFARVDEVEPGVGMGDMRGMLECGLKTEVQILPESGDWIEDAPTMRVGLFSSEGGSEYPVATLLGACDPFMTMSTGKLNAIWRSLITRNSRFKEDLIFSSMGVMGAVIDGQDIKKGHDYSNDEVNKLFIKFVRKLVKTYPQADWFGLAPELGPANQHSGLPTLPLTYNVGDGFYIEDSVFKPVKARLSAEIPIWWLRNAPMVEVDISGDITLSVRAVPMVEGQGKRVGESTALQRDNPDKLISCSNGQEWIVKKDIQDPVSFAAAVGTKEWYTNGIFPTCIDPDTTLVMLVHKKEGGKYQNIGYAWADQDIATDWVTHEFVIE